MTSGYACSLRLIHWLMAILIIGLLGVGLYMEDMPASPDKYALYDLHKSFGIVALVFILLRLTARFTTSIPAPLPTHQGWEGVLARLIHITLYATMILMPLSGWAMSSFGGHPVALFGVNLPSLVAPDKELGGLMRSIHGLSANIMIGAITLHILGALKHHFIDRDATLARMLPSRKATGCSACRCDP